METCFSKFHPLRLFTKRRFKATLVQVDVFRTVNSFTSLCDCFLHSVQSRVYARAETLQMTLSPTIPSRVWFSWASLFARAWTVHGLFRIIRNVPKSLSLSQWRASESVNLHCVRCSNRQISAAGSLIYPEFAPRANGK